MIRIRGEDFSEDTIVLALEKHCNFEEEKKPYIFQAGDVIKNKYGNCRIITQEFTDDLVSYDMRGARMTTGQAKFEDWGYEKIGILSDFINRKNIENLKENQNE